MVSRYDAHGVESEFEPGSRGRVLRNAAMARDYTGMERKFARVIRQTWRAYGKLA